MLINLQTLLNIYNLQIKNIAHVGVNNGNEVEIYKKISSNSQIFLIEPQKKIYKYLASKFSTDKNVHVINIALGNKVGTKNLNLSDTHNGSASLLVPTLHKDLHPEVSFKGSEKVKIEKLDNLNLKKVNFLNIDVQGYELEVLHGATESLKNIDYLIIEISQKQLYANSPVLKDIDRFLYFHGFNRQITVFWDKNCVWGDAFYIKKNLISQKYKVKSMIKNFLYKSNHIYNFFQNIRKIINKTNFL
tara:strand:- start:59575 stop:60312 length:738 start_codon:yes stop_codon:yes gene_type:complete